MGNSCNGTILVNDIHRCPHGNAIEQILSITKMHANATMGDCPTDGG